MTYLLMALYLSSTTHLPELRTQLQPDKDACVTAQTRYLASQVSGTKWAICKKLNAAQQEYANVHGTALP